MQALQGFSGAGLVQVKNYLQLLTLSTEWKVSIETVEIMIGADGYIFLSGSCCFLCEWCCCWNHPGSSSSPFGANKCFCNLNPKLADQV